MRLKEKSKERLKSVLPQQLEEDAIYQDWEGPSRSKFKEWSQKFGFG